MKTITNIKWAGVAFAAIAVVGLSPRAQAVSIPLVYQPGSLFHAPGTLFNQNGTNQITIKLQDYSASTIYSNQTVGSSFGYSGSTTAPGVITNNLIVDTQEEGVAALNSLAGGTGAAPFQQGFGSYAGKNGAGTQVGTANGADTWGIFKVTSIQDQLGDPIFNTTTRELTGIYYGEQDFFFHQKDALTQIIDGSGLKFDVYLDSTPDFNPTPGPSIVAGTAYANATDGTFLFTANSVPGFLHLNASGPNGGLATEYEDTFNQAGLTGNGNAYLSVNPAGPGAAQFDTNGFLSLLGTSTADIKIQFTVAPPITTSPFATPAWSVFSNDPITAAPIPEPSTVLAGLACLLPIFGAGYRRCKKLSALCS